MKRLPFLMFSGPSRLPRKRWRLGRYWGILIMVALLFSGFGVAGAFFRNDPIRMGIYQNEPLSALRSDGRAEGIVVDLLEAMAAEEGWQIEYVPCEFARCMEMLEAGDIDLLSPIAQTEDRAARFDFNQEAILVNWGQIIAPPDTHIDSILNLEGMNIAFLEGDIHAQALQSTMDRFDLDFSYVLVNDYPGVMRMVEEGEADAGVVNRLFAKAQEDGHRVEARPVVFNPIQNRFAAPKGAGEQLLGVIDQYLAAWKADSDSTYYHTLDRWLPITKSVLPDWLYVVLIVAGGAILLLLGGGFLLRAQVRARTAELRAEVERRRRSEEALRGSEKKLHSVIEQSKDGICVTDEAGTVVIWNPSLEQITGQTAGEMVGRTIWDAQFQMIPRDQQSDQVYEKLKSDLLGFLETGQSPWAGQLLERKHHRPDGVSRFVQEVIFPIKTSQGVMMGSITRDITGLVLAEQQALHERETLDMINALNRAANEGASLQEIIDLLCGQVKRVFGTEAATVYMLSNDKRSLVLQNINLPAELSERIEALIGRPIPAVRIPLQPGSIYYDLIQAGRPQTTQDPEEIRRMMTECTPNPVLKKLVPAISRLLGANAVMSIPLVSESGPIGLLDTSRSEPFSETDLELFGTLAGQLTALIERKQTEDAIARLATVIGQAAVTVVITDLKGKIVYANPDFERTTGYSMLEALDQNPRFLQSGQHDPAFYKGLWETIKAGKTWHGIFINRRKGGELYYEDATVFAIRNAVGEIINYAAVKRDISEQVQAQEALRKSERRLRWVIENMPVMMNAFDEEGNILAWNQECERVTGFAADEMIGNPQAMEKLYPDDAYRQKMLVEWQERGDDYRDWEWEMTCKDGRVKTVAWSNIAASFPIPGWATWGIGVDITERERLLAQIQEQAQQIQEVMDTVPEGVLLLDGAGRVLIANPVAQSNLELLTDAGVGDVITHLGDRPLAEILTSPPVKGTWHEVTCDNRVYEVIARPMEDGAEPQGWVLVLRDMTGERGLQEQLWQQERLAAVGQLAAGIAHDFNNILAVILLYTQLSQRTPDVPEAVQNRLELIGQQAHYGSDLINQILDFGRASVLQRKPLDMGKLVKEQVKLLERTLPENIRISLDYGKDDYTINADNTRMQQMVVNLAVNARDAMLSPMGGEMRIVLSRVAGNEDDRCPTCGELIAAGEEWVKLEVTDSGAGIPDDVLPHIFEPFFTTKEAGHGIGLGLAQVYGIVKQHDGHIDVTTRVGEGSSFSISLPALTVQREMGASDWLPLVPRGRGEMVLVVEDNPEVLESVAAGLRALNYRVLEAANGREALELFAHHVEEIALVLSDLVMPGLGGQALFHALKEFNPSIKVVLMTGHPMQEELEVLEEQGLTGWLLKPPGLQKLGEMLARALG